MFYVLWNKKFPYLVSLFKFHMTCPPDGEVLASWIHRPQMGDPQSNPGHAPRWRRWEKARLAAFCSSLLTNWSPGPWNKLYSGGVAGAQWSLCQLCCTAWSRRPLPSPVLCLPLTPVASTLFCGRLSQSGIWGQEGITERYMIPALENPGAKCPAGGKNLGNKLCQICVSHTKVTVVKTC